MTAIRDFADGDLKESRVNTNQSGDLDWDPQHFDFDESKSPTVEVVEKISSGGEAKIEEKTKELQKREVDILKKLRNERHCITLLGSYTKDAKNYKHLELVILQTPRANLDLASLLNKAPTERQGLLSNRDLEMGIGCLASALYFLHNARIRHKDIASKNILVHEGSMLFADFGLSTDFSDTNNSATSGPVGQQKTFRPPEGSGEKARRTKRSCASDVFSLGCVFFEILAALLFSDASAQEDDVTDFQPYHEYLDGINQWLKTERDRIVAAKRQEYVNREFWLEKTQKMLAASPERRPRMFHIILEVKLKSEKQANEFNGVACKFCLENHIQNLVPNSIDVPINLDFEDQASRTHLLVENWATRPTESNSERITFYNVASWVGNWTIAPLARSSNFVHRWHLTFYLDNGRSLRMYGTLPTGNIDLKFDFGDLLIERVVFTAGTFGKNVTLYRERAYPNRHNFQSGPCDQKILEGMTVQGYKISMS